VPQLVEAVVKPMESDAREVVWSREAKDLVVR
jgi:hypothetical protein